MTVSIYYIIIFGVAFAASFWSTPLVIKLAYKANVVDIPKDNRRMHKKTMARMGGVAIIIGLYVALTLYTIFARFEPKLVVDNKLIGFAIGGMIIAVMGLLDDVRGLKPLTKLFLQIAAATVVYAFGNRIEEFKIPFINAGSLIDLGILSYPITIAWVVGITNAINLIDGLDGLAAGISAIAATSMLFVFLMSPLSVEAIVITIALVGSLLGFLPFNFNPAKTFMGDVGSNFLGFTLATVSIIGFTKGYTIMAIVTPIIILGIPIFDTASAIIRRLIKRKSILEADRGHLHHKLIDKGLSQRQVVMFLYIITTVLGMVAVLITGADIWKILFLLAAIVVFVFTGFINSKMPPEEIKKMPESQKKDDKNN